MDALRHARLLATVLLALQGYALARAAGPQTVACHCRAHCGCALESQADDSKLPPCHRHKKQQGPCLRVGCDMPQPALTMVFLLGLPEPQGVELEQLGVEPSWAEQQQRDAPVVERERPPPRSA